MANDMMEERDLNYLIHLGLCLNCDSEDVEALYRQLDYEALLYDDYISATEDGKLTFICHSCGWQKQHSLRDAIEKGFLVNWETESLKWEETSR